MPVYTYRCKSCGVQFEKTQKFDDQPLTRCPECHTGRVRRLVQASSIIFKGTGWYATDHRSVSGQPPSRKDKGKSDTSEGAAETSEGKPAKNENKPAKGIPEFGVSKAQTSGSAAELRETTGHQRPATGC